MDLSGDVKIINRSGEDYPNAKINLIVGTVNLVEKIATLAHNRGGWGKVEERKRERAYMELQAAISKSRRANSSQALVEEDRTINIVKGTNHVDFSWAGTYIVKASIQIRALKTPGETRILSTSYPPGENALFWDIWCEKSGPAKFRISYLITGFTKKTDYLALATKDEKHLDLECRVNLGNRSGESYNKANIQLGRYFLYKDREMLNGQVRKMWPFAAQIFH